MRRRSPFVALALVALGAVFGAGLGSSEAPAAGRSTPPPSTKFDATTTSTGRVLAAELPRCDATGPLCGRLLADVASLKRAVVDGRFVRPVTYGGLTIDPARSRASGSPLGLDPSEAAAFLGYADALEGFTPVVGFGLVSVRGVTAPGGTPRLEKIPAWVGVVLGVNLGPVNCPLEVNAQPSEPVRPEDRVVVLYGEHGRGGVLYDSGGSSPCGGAPIPASLTAALATVPVRWSQDGPISGGGATVSYVAPRCATLSGVSSDGGPGGATTVEVTVSFPFARTRCGPLRTFSTPVHLFPTGPGAPPPPPVTELVESPAPERVPSALVGPIGS